MRKLSWFLIIVILLGCFAGCQAAPEEGAERPIENEDGTLADWMVDEIERFYHTYDKPFKFYDTNGKKPEIRYYGTENGYVLVFEYTGQDSLGEVYVAEKYFFSASDFIIRAYKSGKFIYIKEAYEQGLISKAAIDKAWEIHQEYEHDWLQKQDWIDNPDYFK